jgi:hypothetical protein
MRAYNLTTVQSPTNSRVGKSATYVRCKEILSADCLVKQTERDALIPSGSAEITKREARKCGYSSTWSQSRCFFYLLVCQSLARRNAALRNPGSAVIPVCPVLKLQQRHALVRGDIQWHECFHKPVPMYTRSIWEVILDVDDQAVPLIDLYSWTRVHIYRLCSASSEDTLETARRRIASVRAQVKTLSSLALHGQIAAFNDCNTGRKPPALRTVIEHRRYSIVKKSVKVGFPQLPHHLQESL